MKQIIYEIKSQPLIAAVTVIGTALAIFLMMVVVMLQQVKVIPIAPESDRDRMLYVSGVSFSYGPDDNPYYSSGNSKMASPIAQEFGEDLPGAEGTTVSQGSHESVLIAVAGQPSFETDMRQTDEKFFTVYSFRFLAGKSFDEADVKSHLPKAVISESVTRDTYGNADDAVGKELLIDEVPHTVTGVVADVSPVADHAYAQVWVPIEETDPTDFWGQIGLGPYILAIKAESPDKFKEIGDEINRRVEIVKSRYSDKENFVYDIQGAPYTQADETLHYGGSKPNPSAERRQRLIIYSILLLIPAINLSSMTRSRLRRRTSEIGVRRAFGCTRLRVITDILTENFVITLAGSLIGLFACLIFGSLLFDAVFTGGWFTTYAVKATVSFSSLLNWGMFAYAILFCFILNLLSTGIPAWRASRINPVEAINSSNR